VSSFDERRRYRFKRYVVFIAMAMAMTYLAFLLAPAQGFLQPFSIATAYTSLILLALVLLIGPLNVLRAKSNPLSSYLRRDLAIIAGIVAVVHVIVGLQVHMGGDFIQYFFYRKHGKIGDLRFDAFGITNQLGVIATLIFLVLLAISSNLAMRKLGPELWKTIQRWNYAAAILVIAHGVIYQWLEKRSLIFVAFLLAVTGVVVVLQLLGFWRMRNKIRLDRGPASSFRTG